MTSLSRVLLVGLMMASLAACDPAPTQIIVHVDADDGLRADTDNLRIRVWGRPFEGSFQDDNFMEETAVAVDGSIAWPWRVDLRPGADDPTRVWRLEAAAYRGAAPGQGSTDIAPGLLAVARSSASYQEGSVQHVFLRLYDACTTEDPCLDLDRTCTRLGECVEIPDPRFFDPDAGFPSDDGGMDAGPEDAGVDAGRECAPMAETCNNRDDDCDERVDETFDFDNDVNRCGDCVTVCAAANSTASCSDGMCVYTCDPGYRNCDAVDGCETPIDASDCTGCGVPCPGATPFCADGTCVSSCVAPEEDCGGVCIDTGGDRVDHCGACNRACELRDNTVRTCVDGSCTYSCMAGWDDCNGNLNSPQGTAGADDGCETDILRTLTACGSCTNECDTSTQCTFPVCTDGMCGQANDDGAGCTVGSCSGMCSGGTCDAMCPPDAGPPDAGPCASCPGSCCDGACCANTCCNNMCCGAGEVCSAGACTLPDAGPPDAGPCASCPGSCCGGACCANACCADMCCGVGEVCNAGACTLPDAGGTDAGSDAGPADGGSDAGSADGGPSGCDGPVCGVGCCDVGETCCGGVSCCVSPTCSGACSTPILPMGL